MNVTFPKFQRNVMLVGKTGKVIVTLSVMNHHLWSIPGMKRVNTAEAMVVTWQAFSPKKNMSLLFMR